MCQLPAKELPARPPSPTPSPDPEATQPLRELGVNKAEDPRTPSNQSAGRGAEKPGEVRAPREPLGSYRGVSGPPRGILNRSLYHLFITRYSLCLYLVL